MSELPLHFRHSVAFDWVANRSILRNAGIRLMFKFGYTPLAQLQSCAL